jgi:hypothetical protein
VQNCVHPWGLSAKRVGGRPIRDECAQTPSPRCGGGAEREAWAEKVPGPDGVVALAPAVEGDAVWYLRATSTCYVNSYALVRFDARSRRTAFGALSGEILDLARDGGALYALVAPKPQGETPRACTPCTIERLDPPAMAPRHYEPHSPFF